MPVLAQTAVAPSRPAYRWGKVLCIEDYRPDAAFKERVMQLRAGRSMEEMQELTGIHPNQWRSLEKHGARLPTFNMLQKLASLQDWATPTWVATGHDEAEDTIDTIEQLHAWDMQIAKRRLRYFEAILAQQQAMVAGTRPLSTGDDAALQALSEGLVERQRTARGQAPAGPRQAAAPRDGESRPKS